MVGVDNKTDYKERGFNQVYNFFNYDWLFH